MERQPMQVFVNGDAMEIVEGATVADLVRQLTDDPRGMAIERNREIVPKSAHATTQLADGDRLEVVQFVGGG
jgi:thiamine biosynthesis protein ThiS